MLTKTLSKRPITNVSCEPLLEPRRPCAVEYPCQIRCLQMVIEIFSGLQVIDAVVLVRFGLAQPRCYRWASVLLYRLGVLIAQVHDVQFLVGRVRWPERRTCLSTRCSPPIVSPFVFPCDILCKCQCPAL